MRPQAAAIRCRAGSRAEARVGTVLAMLRDHEAATFASAKVTGSLRRQRRQLPHRGCHAHLLSSGSAGGTRFASMNQPHSGQRFTSRTRFLVVVSFAVIGVMFSPQPVHFIAS